MSVLGFPAGDLLAWLPVLSIAVFLGGGLRLRAKAKRFPVVDGTPEGSAAPGRQWLLAEGITVDEGTRSGAVAHAQHTGLDVLDLVPTDLPFQAALDLVRLVEPRTYARDRLTSGRSAGQALVATPDVLERAEVKHDPGADRRMDPVELLATGVDLKKYAPASAGLALAPSLRAAGLGGRRARLGALGVPRPVAIAWPLLTYAALAAGVVVNPLWGVGALAAFSLQPYVIFAGARLRPRDLHLAALGRLAMDPAHWVETAFGDPGVHGREQMAKKQAQIAASRVGYTADIAAGVDRYLEPRRPNCPWCGGAELAVVLTTPDLLQGKPGTFTLERCGRCGHVFQNPRLTVDGLEFYYRDFYDGGGENMHEFIFGGQAKTYRVRAEMLKPHATAPRSWLDVGTGHGHFCTAARDVWPSTTFDGLEMTESIEAAERRGWVNRGIRGMFPEVADGLADSYDVVSMSHYLEHTREPFQELDAAAKVLVPGGHLLIEVPDPEWPMGRVLKRFWIPWLQPQHQHLIPMENLKEALLARGLVPVREERVTNGIKLDLSGAVLLAMGGFLRDPRDLPWSLRSAGAAHGLARVVASVAIVPLVVVAAVLDTALSVPLRRSGKGVAYRVVARKAEPSREAAAQ